MHDLSDGGLAVALARKWRWQAGSAPRPIWRAIPITPRRNGGSARIRDAYLVTVPDVEALNAALAKGTRDEDTAQIGFQRVGTVGGDAVLGVPLNDLRAANQRFFDEWMEG